MPDYRDGADRLTADAVRELLTSDSSALPTGPAAVRTLLAAALVTLDAAEADLAALNKEVQALRTRNGLRGPIADGIATLTRLPPDQRAQVFTAHADGLITAAQASITAAHNHAAACRNAAAGAAHHARRAQQALAAGDIETAARILDTLAQLRVPAPATFDPSALEDLADVYDGIAEPGLDDLFD